MYKEKKNGSVYYELDEDEITRYKNMGSWTLRQCVDLSCGLDPIDPCAQDLSYDPEYTEARNNSHLELKRRLDSMYMADNVGRIKATHYNEHDMYQRYPYYKPFECLEVLKEAGHEIHPYFDFVKNNSISGEIKYSWAVNNKNNTESKSLFGLSGKEKQEYGRLRTEKKTMDSTVKAAIEVGKFIKGEEKEGRLIVKKNIIDLINKFDGTIPTTRIEFIWKSIPNEIKKGSGRPKKG